MRVGIGLECGNGNARGCPFAVFQLQAYSLGKEMGNYDSEILIDQAKAIATFGFEQGFRQAIDFIQGVAEQGRDKESREIASIFVKTLQDALPGLLKEVPEMFTFQIIKNPSGMPEIKIQ